MIGQKIIQLESVDSTNNYVANLISANNIEHGTVILADNQTNGRGQRGNVWDSKPGENLIFSLYAKPENLSVNKQFFLSMAIALACNKTLQNLNIESKIKWPNDILIGNKKIAGILIENQLKSTNIEHSIIGIGFNINEKGLNKIGGISLIDLKGKFTPILEFTFQLIQQIKFYWNKVYLLQFKEIKAEYLSNLWLLNEDANFEINNEIKIGKIIDITEEGRLLIDFKNQIQAFDFKEISFLDRNTL